MVTLDTRHQRPTLACLALLASLLVSSLPVEAKSYSLDRLSIHARVDRQGSLWIDETRAYTFDGQYSWADFRLPLDRVGAVRDFSLSEGGTFFDPSLGEEPGTYSLQTSSDQLYVKWHFAARNETRSFRLRYRITEAVAVHRDVAELYFQFVGEINPQSIGSVEVDLELPEVAIFDQVRAWAHGPLHGRVDFLESGHLSFNIVPLRAQQMWEARVVFPPHWIRASSPSTSDEAALVGILAEEEAWALDANARRERAASQAEDRVANNRLAGWIAVALAALAFLTVLLGYMKAGRAHPVSYAQKMDSALPSEPPALVSYLYNAKTVTGSALGACRQSSSLSRAVSSSSSSKSWPGDRTPCTPASCARRARRCRNGSGSGRRSCAWRPATITTTIQPVFGRPCSRRWSQAESW